MDEREQAIRIASDWLDFKMNSLVQMVHGDPDCDACVLARQHIRACDRIEALKSPTDAMLIAARDWSYKKYGKPIGNDAAIGCWQAMLSAVTCRHGEGS